MRALLKERYLLAHLAGNLLSIAGTWAQRVVIIWMAWELTGSSSVIGPVLGGWAVASETPAVIFGFNVVNYMIFATVFAVLGVRPRLPSVSDGQDADGARPSPFCPEPFS